MTEIGSDVTIAHIPAQRAPAEESDAREARLVAMVPSLLRQLSPPPVPEERRLAIRASLLAEFDAFHNPSTRTTLKLVPVQSVESTNQSNILNPEGTIHG